jgi:hypothetical protein
MVQSTKSSPDALLKAAEKLSPRQLDRFVNGVLRLRAKRHSPCLSNRESKLLLQINKGISEAQSARYAELISKRRAESLTSEEHAELIRMGNQVEKLEAKRLAALIALAALRNVTLTTLMKDLGIKAPENE